MLDMRRRIAETLYKAAVLLVFIFAAWVVYFITTNSSRLDFRVFYGAATAAAQGQPIYTLYGIYMMPFWYFPWVAWFYTPLTLGTFSQAWYTYVLICCALLWGLIAYYSRRFRVTENVIDRIFLYSMALLLCMMLFNFGQTNILVLAFATLVAILLERGRLFQAGLLLPLTLIKPHLLIIFVAAALIKGGRQTFLGAAVSSLGMFALEFLIDSAWLADFLELFRYGLQRDDKLYWGHTTLPALLGYEENFVGTANLGAVIVLLLVSLFIVWRFRKHPPAELIALSLAASLFSAPRAFSYDLVLLLPAMMLISRNFDWKTLLFWIVAIVIPFAFNFSTGSYFLTLLVLALTVWKLHSQAASEYITNALQGTSGTHT